MTQGAVPERVDAVVIGAGALGASTAFHLISAGLSVALVDKAEFASQTSPRAAGLSGQLRSSEAMTRIASRSVKKIETFQADTGEELVFFQPGSLKIARRPEHEAQLHEEVARGQHLGLDVALISLEDIEEGARELDRAAKLGLKGAMIWGAPPVEKPYWQKVYDRFWATAQDLQMPLSLHVITGKKPPRNEEERKKQRTDDPGFIRGYMNILHEVQRSLTDIISGGVLMRFPRLKLVSAENDAGWIPHYMYRLDHAFEKFGVMMREPLDMKPSEYIRRNLWATFQDDPIGPMLFRFFGEDNFMWASDFPHTDSTWPHSLKVIERDFEQVPDSVKQKIIRDNAAKLYRIPLN